jgi:hypothetical protein
MYAYKKISPAGHWIGITGVANQGEKTKPYRSIVFI